MHQGSCQTQSFTYSSLRAELEKVNIQQWPTGEIETLSLDSNAILKLSNTECHCPQILKKKRDL